MKIVLVVVTSIDGITSQEGASSEAHHVWASEEDQDFFKKARDKFKLLLMGRKTYEAASYQMIHKLGKLRVVFTRNPEKYLDKKIPDQLEFTAESPDELIKKLEKRGYSEALLVGGADISGEFFKYNLVNEIWQTIEPVLLGKGSGIIGITKDVKLKLLSLEKLNEKGTLLLKYKVI